MLESKNPSNLELLFLVGFVMSTIACSSARDDPPSVSAYADAGAGSSSQHAMHRLTRVEYGNTVRDLLGEPRSVAGELPEDQKNALGYDNDGISLVTSPLLVERYSDVAQELVAALFARRDPFSWSFSETNIAPRTFVNGQPVCPVLAPGQICGTVGGAWFDATKKFWGLLSVTDPPGVSFQLDGFKIPVDGKYTFAIQAFADPVICKDPNAPGPTKYMQPYPVSLQIMIDAEASQFDVTLVPASAPQIFKLTTTLKKGVHSVSLTSLPDLANPFQVNDPYHVSLYLGDMSFTAEPVVETGLKASDVLSCGGAASGSDECMTHVLEKFATRAWRRSVSAAEVTALKSVADSVTKSNDEPGTAEEKFKLGTQLALQATLLSPSFIYRPELDPDPASPVAHPLNDYELASRLSYFLWSSMPDDELFARAEDGTLHMPAVLDAQVERMLDDPKADALAENFAGQWLTTRIIPDLAPPDAKTFPAFNPDVRAAMTQETKLYFREFLKPDQKLPDFFDAKFTFVNKVLAGFYGVAAAGAVTDADFVKVSLEGSHRGGILGQGSILTLTSLPLRTSPVRRGKFVLNRFLCSSPPPPPPDVPAFNENVAAGSVRQRLEPHAIMPGCMGCHDSASFPMDPIGFAMENFDAVGKYRVVDGAYPIDTTKLAVFEKPVSDVESLSKVIKQSDKMMPCLTLQLFSYAVGQQAAETRDGEALKALIDGAAPGGFVLRDMIHAIVKSDAFTTHAGGVQ